MKKVIVIGLIYFFVSSCVCGPDEKIGSTQLDENALSYLVYSKNKKLIFKNSTGYEFILQSNDGLNFFRSWLIVKELCNNGMFNTQHQYIEGDYYSIVYSEPTLGQVIVFILQNAIATTSDSYVLFDVVNIECSYHGNFVGILDLVISDNIEEIPLEYSSIYLRIPSFVSDTVLNGKVFQNVWWIKSEYFNPNTESTIFYSKEMGVIAFKYEDKDMLVLDRIE